MRTRGSFAAVALLTLSGRAVAQDPAVATPSAPARATAPKADPAVGALLEPVLRKHQLPGLVGAIVRGDALEAIAAVGVRKAGSPEPIRVDDVVHLGSDTKAMTATRIAMLVEQGRLTWDTTVGDAFPDLRDEIHPDFQKVTLTELLSHRGSLPANGPWWDLGSESSTTEQRRTLAKLLMKGPPGTKPGSKMLYSNAGYAIAGLMAEAATGQSWEDLMRDGLFRPLGLASAGFGPVGTMGTVDQPWGHKIVDGRPVPIQADNAPALGPAGTVHMSVPDWAKFASLHLAGGRGERGLLLRPETFQVLQTPSPGTEYAPGGWVVVSRPWAGGRVLTHGGSNTMWMCTAWVAPARDFAILVATNRADDAAAKGCDEAATALIGEHQRRSEAPAAPGPRPAGTRPRSGRSGRRGEL